MGTTSKPHAFDRQATLNGKPLREKGPLKFTASQVHQHGNRETRKQKFAGANPYHSKGGENWRRDAWLWGVRWAHPRTLHVVDAKAVEARGKNKRCPVAVESLAVELTAKRNRVKKPPQHTRQAQR